MKKTMIPWCKKVAALAVAGLSIGACMPEDDFQDIQVLAPSPSISLPILNTNLRVSDLIKTEEGGLLEENPDGSYSLFYRTNVQSLAVGEYFPPIPPQQYAESLSLGLNAPAFFLSPEPLLHEGIIPVELGGLSIYGIECKQGYLNLSLNSDYDHDISISITFPDILDADQQPLILDFDFPRWGAKNGSQYVDLTGYRINIHENTLSYTAEVSISGSGSAINETDQVSINLNIADIDFSYIEGNFSAMEVPVGADSLEIPMLANAINGNLALNPRLRIDFANSFGVPVLTDLSNVYVKRKSGTIVRLEDEGESHFFSGAYDFPYLTDRNELPAFKSQEVDQSNSNIEEAFAELPRGIAYYFGFNLNSSPEDTSFIADNSSIGVDVEVELPLEGSFDIRLQDTLAIDLGFEQDVEELKVLIKTENGFPIDADLQIYFLDENGEMIYDINNEAVKLFDDQAQLLKAAEIINSSTGETQAASIDMPIAATISAEKFRMIQEAGSMLVETRLQSNSADNNMIRLYASYGIRFSLAMQIKSPLNVSN
jgi:hypothetical protein